MAKIKEIRVELKRSVKFQTYSYGETIQLEDQDDLEETKNKSFARARKATKRQILIDFPEMEDNMEE